jgi:hypothetical protein
MKVLGAGRILEERTSERLVRSQVLYPRFSLFQAQKNRLNVGLSMKVVGAGRILEE